MSETLTSAQLEEAVRDVRACIDDGHADQSLASILSHIEALEKERDDLRETDSITMGFIDKFEATSLAAITALRELVDTIYPPGDSYREMAEPDSALGRAMSILNALSSVAEDKRSAS